MSSTKVNNPLGRFKCPACGYMVYKKDQIDFGLLTGKLMHAECAGEEPYIGRCPHETAEILDRLGIPKRDRRT
jgi:hypothetical protein